MTWRAQITKSVTLVPGRKCNPCVGTFRNRTKSEPKRTAPCNATVQTEPNSEPKADQGRIKSEPNPNQK
jgi:hypothetical protein